MGSKLGVQVVAPVLLNFQGFLLVGQLVLAELLGSGQAQGMLAQLLGFGSGVGAGVGALAGLLLLLQGLLVGRQNSGGGGKLRLPAAAGPAGWALRWLVFSSSCFPSSLSVATWAS